MRRAQHRVETSSGQIVFDKDLGHGPLPSLAFAPDGKHVAVASYSGFLSLVETSSGQMVFDKDLGHGQLPSLALKQTQMNNHGMRHIAAANVADMLRHGVGSSSDALINDALAIS